MDDQKQNQTQDTPNNAPTETDQSGITTPIDPQEQEELNQLKDLEKEEHEEVQADAAQIDKREMEGKELEEEAKNLPPETPSKAQ